MKVTAPEILSYADRLSVFPGEDIEFKVSCLSPGECEATVVRLRHGDRNPAGPGYKEREIVALPPFPARSQKIDLGSFVRVDDERGLLLAAGSFSVHAFIYPTTPERADQVVLGRWSEETGGRALALGPDGIELWVGDGETKARVATGTPLYGSCWYSVAATFDADSGAAFVSCVPLANSTNGLLGAAVTIPGAGEAEASLAPGAARPDLPFAIAASTGPEGSFEQHYNGKVERPAVWERALSREELAGLARDSAGRPAEGLVASWDFAANVEGGSLATDLVVDRGPHGLDGSCCNGPARGMTGFDWRGEEFSYVHAPEQYGAIHFHDDDLENCGWETDLTWRVPDDLPSGIYALKVDHHGATDRLPFFVPPPRGKATADLLLVIPTASYLAYANERMLMWSPVAQAMMGTPVLEAADVHFHERTLLGLSLYDPHSDGSGCHLSSALRPIVNLRPDKRTAMDAPWQFPADLHLVDWLEEKGLAFDVVTDLELHREGAELLGRYRAVVTGTHPEYVSEEILDAWEGYLADGGRGIYLGGNGFYWVTNFHPSKPFQIEVRRGETGTRAWEALPGELHLQTNGRRGGLWRWRGRAPQKLFGVGFATEGFDRGSYYLAGLDIDDPQARFVFDGVDPKERIGDCGLAGGGAAGLELDRYDLALGTPPNASLLAYSTEHSDHFLRVVEELGGNMISTGGTTDYQARGDLVFFPTQEGGGVFSAGSIAWCGSLSEDGYENSVSRITENVLRRFLDPAPLPDAE
jgi:N,N-dimethylformamidase